MVNLDKDTVTFWSI